MKEKPVSDKKLTGQGRSSTLILFNDEFNSFDHVIKSLVEVCGHDPLQAEQCAHITHFRGSCEVKTGKRNILVSMNEGLTDRNLTSEVK